MMNTKLNKYEVLLTSVKWNKMSPDLKIGALTTVVEKLKDHNPNLSKSAKTAHKKQTVNRNHPYSRNINFKGKNK